jgi:hypothetical protein
VKPIALLGFFLLLLAPQGRGQEPRATSPSSPEEQTSPTQPPAAAPAEAPPQAPPETPKNLLLPRFGWSLELPAATPVMQESSLLVELDLGRGCLLRLGQGDGVKDSRKLLQLHQRIYLGGTVAVAPTEALSELPPEWKTVGGLFKTRVQGFQIAALFWEGPRGGSFAYLRCEDFKKRDPWLDRDLGLVSLLKGLKTLPK